MTWAQRLKRVFGIDIETCPVCGGAVRVIACIEDTDVIEKILTHLDVKGVNPKPRGGGHAERHRSEGCSTGTDVSTMTRPGLQRRRWGYGSGWPGGGRTKKNVPANGLPGWLRASTCRPDAVRWSPGRPSAGVDGCDQAIQLAEKAFHTAYTPSKLNSRHRLDEYLSSRFDARIR